MSEAFADLGARFESQHPDVQVVFNYAGSQQLAHQLAQGAPADVFASANLRQMEAAIQSGRVNSEGVRSFAHNRLVVIYPGDNPGGIQTLADLSRPGLKLGLAAETVPVGDYALQFLQNASQVAALGDGFREGVLDNVVSYEVSVRAVLSKVLLGEVDGGIVYASDITPEDDPRLGHLEIPAALNINASYYLAPVVDSPHLETASAFVDFVVSHEGQSILTEYGLMPVDMGLMEASN